jgi:hypothetical protein
MSLQNGLKGESSKKLSTTFKTENLYRTEAVQGYSIRINFGGRSGKVKQEAKRAYIPKSSIFLGRSTVINEAKNAPGQEFCFSRSFVL